MLLSNVHSPKDVLPIADTEGGRTTLRNDAQLKKALESIFATEPPSFSVLMLIQFENAFASMRLTVSGTVIPDRDLQ